MIPRPVDRCLDQLANPIGAHYAGYKDGGQQRASVRSTS